MAPEHECSQLERIAQHDLFFNQVNLALGEIRGSVAAIPAQLAEINKRINGAFDEIGDHVKTAPTRIAEIEELKITVKTIKEEKMNTTKASQWRIALICSSMVGLIGIGVQVLLHFIK